MDIDLKVQISLSKSNVLREFFFLKHIRSRRVTHYTKTRINFYALSGKNEVMMIFAMGEQVKRAE